MAEITKVLSHFLKDGEVWHCHYWEIPRRDKQVCHLKVAGDERRCECPNKEAIRKQLTFLLTSGGG